MRTKVFGDKRTKQRCHHFREEENGSEGLMIWCLACNEPHRICTKQGKGTSYPIWTFNGNYKFPVFSPSILCYYDVHTRDKDGNITSTRKHTTCHNFVGNNGAKPGQIIYLNDSAHKYAGKVLWLPEFSLRGNWFERMHRLGEQYK